MASKKDGKKETTNRVVIKEPVSEKKVTPAEPTPTAEVTAPPPAGGFIIKDEVEMLRAGFKNKHGSAVKTQAQTTNIEL